MQAPGERRSRELAQRVEQIRGQIEEGEWRPITLRDMESDELPDGVVEPTIDLAGLERVLSRIAATNECLEPHAQIGGAYLLTVGPFRAAPVTFRVNVLDQHAPAVRLLTYLTPEFEALLEHGIEELGGDASLSAADDEPLESLAEVANLFADQ